MLPFDNICMYIISLLSGPEMPMQVTYNYREESYTLPGG